MDLLRSAGDAADNATRLVKIAGTNIAKCSQEGVLFISSIEEMRDTYLAATGRWGSSFTSVVIFTRLGRSLTRCQASHAKASQSLSCLDFS
jgi:hypothetical protein